MKKIITIVLSIMLCIGAIGGSFALAKHIDGKVSVEQPNDSSNDSSDENEDSGNNGVNQKNVKWELCTDVSQLAVGDQIIIAVSSGECALSTTQNTSNRSAANIAQAGESLSLDEAVQIITLEKGVVENTFAFNVGDGYLYAPSSASNHLKTHSIIDENSSWQILIDESGVATITAQGESTRNVLMYNSTNRIFSCYMSTQNAVVIYKMVESVEE